MGSSGECQLSNVVALSLPTTLQGSAPWTDTASRHGVMNSFGGRRDGPETILGSRSLWFTAAIVGISPGTRSCLSHSSDLACRGGGRNVSEFSAARACPARLRCGPQPDIDDALWPAGAHAGASAPGDRHQSRCRRRRLDRGYPGGQGSILDRADRNVFHRRGPNRQGTWPSASLGPVAARPASR